MFLTCACEKKRQVVGIQKLHAGDTGHLGVVVVEIIYSHSMLPVPNTEFQIVALSEHKL